MYISDALEDLNAIAVIGISCQFPGAKNAESFWQNISDAIESVEELSIEELLADGRNPEIISANNYVNRVSRLKDVDLFDADFFAMTAREASITSPSQRLLLQCAYEAVEDASYSLETCTRNIGVFVGTNRCDEWQKRLYALAANDSENGARQLQWFIANDLDYAATRISHKLNLHGPSLNISTACSTSLVAIHQACRSLLSYESDMALAGGANVALEQYYGYAYQYGGIQSHDGYCRAFDEKSDGTLFGSGAGVVLLKRFDEALADGDHIYGIVRGSAINNDGSAKVGFTAPSVTGQAEVISSALAVANVDPAEISLIEAHGTGTSLGDPIEIQALTKAYRRKTKKNQFCAVSSVKTNIGHLGSAAGIAGFIKALFALKNKTLPPNLHFNNPNPEIDFANSPFYIPKESQPWPSSSHARFAGVSSFGVGGTNAHIILQEAPERFLAPIKKNVYVLILSARSAQALQTMASNLAKFLQGNPLTNLRDLSYSLNCGRNRFEFTTSVVIANLEDAIKQLTAIETSAISLTKKEDKPNLCFMFPGQGAQYANMCAELYDTYPIFKETVDQCAIFLKDYADFDLRDYLFCNKDKEPETNAALSQTAITQPALFTIEYALAKLWMSYGVVPTAMIGHSIGEYVAACLANVFSVADALKIVFLRGTLMQSMPAGAMLAVALGEAELAPYLKDCELAAVNSAAWCVATGTETAIACLEKTLSEQKIFCKRIHTSHAFHSAMMEPMLDEFTAAVRNIKLSPPQIPFVSNLTGQWIKNAEATNPAYWAKHLRETVKFHAGIHELIKSANSILLEVGPGQALSSLVQNSGNKVIASSRQMKQTVSDNQIFLTALGRLVCAGIDVNWKNIFSGETCSRLPLPTYPFELKRFWIEPLSKTSAANEFISQNSQVRMVAGDYHFNVESENTQPSNRSLDFKHYVISCVTNLLGVNEVSTEIPLVELGLNSLMAIELRTKINAVIGDDSISVVDLLDESATINNLSSLYIASALASAAHQSLAIDANNIDTNNRADNNLNDKITDAINSELSEHAIPIVFSGEQPIQPDLARAYEPFPLTDIQQAYWIGRSGNTDGGNVATYAYIEMDVSDIDVVKYQAALNTLIQRHHMLRMHVLENGMQQFLRDVPEYVIPIKDLSTLTASERDNILAKKRDEMSHQVLDTTKWPLFDVCIHKMDEHKYRLHYGFDFMIVDVLSLMVFFRDLFLIYVGRENKLEPLELCFRDYVLAEQNRRQSDLYLKSKKYWQNKLTSLPMPPQLPLTKDAAQVTDPKYVRRDFTLDTDTWARLKGLAKQYKITPSVLIATAYSEILRQWTSAQKFTLNLTIFNRPRLHRQMNDLIGDFTSSVLLEVDMTRSKAFSESTKAVQSQLLLDLEHRLFNGVEVLRALNSSKGGYQSVVMPYVLTSALGLDQYSESRLVGLEEEELQRYEEMMELGHTISQTSQVWLDHVVREKNSCLLCNWDSLEEIFPAGLLDDMFCAYYDRLIELANAGTNAWEAMPQPPIPEYQLRNRAQVNATNAPISTALLHELLDNSVKNYAHNVAIINGDISIPYWQLQAAAQQLSQLIKTHGARPNTLVGIVMDKGWEQIAAVFGSLYSGAAYMPIDASLPPERIMKLLAQGEVNCVLTQPHVAAQLTFPAHIHCEIVTKKLLESAKYGVTYNRVYSQTATDLAYVLFTSGSTGIPKGVMISHQSAVNTVLDINQRFSITENDRAIAINALNFDLSIYDIFGLLAVGGGLVMPEYSRALDPKHWVELVETQGVTFWNTVPAIVQLYVEELETQAKTAINSPIHIRYIFMSGDWIPVALPQRIRQALPNTLPVSLGGPTETTVWSIYHPIHQLDSNAKSVTYGKPLANRAHYILHNDLTPCPDWVTGIIYTGGRIGVAEGYWRDEEKTQQVFITHPISGERIYCTGDMGRFLPDGNIEFMGRIDNQVKIQGHRIELGEIEFALRKIPGVEDAIVIPVTEYKNDSDKSDSERKVPNKLIAFYINKTEATDADEIFAGDLLSDPLKIALFKLEQHGIRHLAKNVTPILLPAKPIKEKALQLGCTTHNTLTESVTEENLGNILACLAQVVLPDYSLPKYYYPSAGSAHPIQAYLHIYKTTIGSIQPGIYYYNPALHALTLVNSSHEAPVPETKVPETKVSEVKMPEANAAGFAIILASYNPAIEPLYGDIGSSRFNFVETGHVENLLLGRSVRESISLVPTAFNKQDISQLIRVDADYKIIRVLKALKSNSPDSKQQVLSTAVNLIERQSYRTFVKYKQNADEFQTLLTQMCSLSQRFPVAELPAVYIYVKPNRFNNLAGGFYRYDLATATMQLQHAITATETVGNLQYSRNKDIHTESSFSVIFVANRERQLQTQLQMMAAGYIAQGLQNISTSMDIGLCSTGGLKRSLVANYIALQDSDDIIYCLEGGGISAKQKASWVTETMHQEKTQNDNAHIREVLKTQLPYYMVPAALIAIDQFPLTPNGKIDRKALATLNLTKPEPEHKIKILPGNVLEETLVKIWCSILEIDEISMDDNLFELGGDSLTATKLISEIQKSLQINIPLHKLFADPTVMNTVELCQASFHEEATNTQTIAGAESLELDALINVNVSDVLVDFGVMTDTLLQDAVLPKKYSPASPHSYAVNGAPSDIFLTGASGFLGAYVLQQLLERTSAQITCLVRVRSNESAKLRLIQNLKKYGLWNAHYTNRIVAVEGDIAQPRLGLTDTNYLQLSAQIDAVYHVASLVNYARSYGELKKINVNGALSIIDFSFAGKIKSVAVISTKYVCFGLTPAGVSVSQPEASISDPAGMFIGYTQSKWVVEQLFAQAGAQGLPVSIIRPGQITAATQGNIVLPDDAFHHLIELFVSLNVSPRGEDWKDGVIDIIPVDFAAKSIVDIGSNQNSYGKYFNMVNPYPITMDVFFEKLNSWWENPKMVSDRVRAVNAVEFDEWAGQCVKAIEAMEDKAAAYVLSRFFVKTEFGWFIKGLFLQGDLHYDNTISATENYLSEMKNINEKAWETYFMELKNKMEHHENICAE